MVTILPYAFMKDFIAFTKMDRLWHTTYVLGDLEPFMILCDTITRHDYMNFNSRFLSRKKQQLIITFQNC